MKIVQTFWSGNQTAETYLHNKAGWLSAEFHWMAWALSSLQIRVFYDELELITDSVGKQFFEDVLALPFTGVKAELDLLNQYDSHLWALAKIYAYSLQDEPFIHLDSDVFIWKRFDEKIEKAALISQNIEEDFEIYEPIFNAVTQHLKLIPQFLKESLLQPSIKSYNAGVIGGHDIDFFKKYKELVFEIIDKNAVNLPEIGGGYFNNYIEQVVYFAYAEQLNLEVKTVFEAVQDPTYPNYADFHDVPQQVTFIHAMAEYKRKPVVCNHLARRLRLDFPKHYYHIIDICSQAGVALHWLCYPASKLDTTWLGFYERDKAIYKTVVILYSKTKAEIMASTLVFDTICQIEETEVPVFCQTLIYPNITQLTYARLELDNLNMVLLDAFLEPKSIEIAIKEVSFFFKEENPMAISEKFTSLCMSRIKDLMYLGVMINSK